MNTNIENKCEKSWFEHAWKDNHNEFFAVNPPPPRADTCKNCWLVRTHMSETKTWVEYSDWKERPWEYVQPLIPC